MAELSRYESRQRIKRDLQERLSVLRVGEPLPPVRVLASECGTSVKRLNGIFEELQGEGVIDRQHGRGIFKASSQNNVAEMKGTLRVCVVLDSWPSGTHSYAAGLFVSMQDQALRSERKYHLVCEFTDFATKGEDRFARFVNDPDVDVIVAIPYSRKGLALLNDLKPQGKPVICFARHLQNPDIPSVYVDHVKGAELATQHLLHLGHKNIGIVTVPAFPGNPAWDRLVGYEQAYKAVGLSPKKSFMMETEESFKAIDIAITAMFSQAEPITALFVADGMLLPTVLHVLTQISKRVPEDLSVVSYDDTVISQTYTTPISIVRQCQERAIAALLQEISAWADNKANKRVDVALMPELVIRGSTLQLMK